MKRNSLNFLIDSASALIMAGMVATGLILWFVLPPGSGHSGSLWGLGRHGWGDVHAWLAVGAGAVIALHVALHWQWICVTAMRCVPAGGDRTPPTPRTRHLAGAAMLLLLPLIFGGFILLAKSAVVTAPGESPRMSQHAVGTTGNRPGAPLPPAGGAEAGDRSLRGSMTLVEISSKTGIPVEAVRDRLGLPEEVDAGERLGRLAAKHHFTMQQARQRLADAPVPAAAHAD